MDQNVAEPIRQRQLDAPHTRQLPSFRRTFISPIHVLHMLVVISMSQLLSFFFLISQDGNGRLVRIVASLPLLQHGFPPISITLAQRVDYYVGIRKVSFCSFLFLFL